MERAEAELLLSEFDGDRLDDLERGLQSKYGVGFDGLASLRGERRRTAKRELAAWVAQQRAYLAWARDWTRDHDDTWLPPPPVMCSTDTPMGSELVVAWRDRIVAAAGERVCEFEPLPPAVAKIRRKGRGICPKCAGATLNRYCRLCGPRYPAAWGPAEIAAFHRHPQKQDEDEDEGPTTRERLHP